MFGKHRQTIVHVVNTLEGGGTERTLLRLLCDMDRSRTRHVVVTLRRGGALVPSLPDDVACQALNANRSKRSLALELAAIAAAHGAVAIHARNTGCWADATLAKLRCRRPRLILGFHGLEHGNRFSMRDRLVVTMAHRLGAQFTSVSHSGADKLESELRIDPTRIRIIPNGVTMPSAESSDPKRRRHARRSFGICDADFVIGTVGSFVPVKRLDLLIAAFAVALHRAPNIRLLLVGDGRQRDSIIHQCRHLGVLHKVTRLGWCEDTGAAYAAMNAFVCASDSEGMSNALLEAAAAKLPIIATNVGDNATVLQPGRDAVIVPPGNVESLAAALADLATNAQLCQVYGRAAGVRAKDFDFRNTIRAYNDLYDARPHPDAHPSPRLGAPALPDTLAACVV